MNETNKASAPPADSAASGGSPLRRERQLELELARLARRIEELVATLAALKDENRALRQRHENLTTERAALMQKNEQVRARVEAMIGRLKTLEHGA